MKIKSLFLIILVLALSLSIVGCRDGLKKDEAKALVEDFLEAVQNNDFEKAATYLHPEKPFDIEKYFNGIEERKSIDFQSGIEIKRYTEYSYSAYDSEIDGSDCELEFNVIVDGVGLEMNIEIVKNDLGFGIYEIDIDQ